MGDHLKMKANIKQALYVGVAFPLLAASPVAAQDAGASNGLDAIVVTARKREESVQDVPTAVTAMSGLKLQERGVRDVSDFVRISPGVNAAASNRSATGVRFIFRGQAPADSLLVNDASAAVYVNDVYVPRDYGLKTALFDIGRVEILKGPQGTLYGKNSTGGAVGIFPTRPNIDAAEGYVKIDAGEHNTLSAEAAANLPLGNHTAAFRLSGLAGTTDGGHRNFAGENLRKRHDRAVRGAFLLEPGNGLSIAATLGYTHTDGTAIGFKLIEVTPGTQSADIEAGLQLGAANSTAAGPIGDAYYNSIYARQSNWVYGDTTPGETYDGVRGSLVIGWDLSNALKLKSVTGYEHFTRAVNTDFDGTPLVIANTASNTEDTFFSQELQLSANLLGDRLHLVTGGYYSHEKGSEYANTVTVPSLTGGRQQIYDARVTNESLGVYAQGDLEVVDGFALSAGVRNTSDHRDIVSLNRNITGATTTCMILAAARDTGAGCQATAPGLRYNRTNYTFSASYKPMPGINLYATTRSGFRSGGYNIFSDQTQGITSFRPEKVEDIEIGLKSELMDRRLRFNLAAYRSKYTDIQKATFVFFANGSSTRAIDNAASATIKGVEAELAAVLASGFELDATLAYTDARYDEFLVRNAAGVVTENRTAEPFEVPKWAYTLGAAYTAKLPGGDLKTRLDWAWRSNVYFTQLNKLTVAEQVARQRAYGLLNGRISYEMANNGLTLSLVGTNLLNKYYLIGASDIRALGYVAGFAGDPRYVGVQIQKRW